MTSQARAVGGAFRLRILSYGEIGRIVVGQAVIQVSWINDIIRVLVIGDLTVASTLTQQDWKELLGGFLTARTRAQVVPLYDGASLRDRGKRAESDSCAVAATLEAAIQAEITTAYAETE